MSSAEPRINEVCAAIQDWIVQGCRDGQILPLIKSFPASPMIERLKSFPALHTNVQREVSVDNRQVKASLVLALVMDDPKDDRARDDIRRSAWQIANWLAKQDRYAGAQVETFQILYFNRRKDEGSLMWAELHLTALYHGGRR